MRLKVSLGVILLILAGLVFAGGCQQAKFAQSDVGATAEMQGQSQAARGGAQLWQENCARCHYYRRPRSRTDSEWTIITHHMRVRANLTAEEHEKITRFLRAAN